MFKVITVHVFPGKVHLTGFKVEDEDDMYESGMDESFDEEEEGTCINS